MEKMKKLGILFSFFIFLFLVNDAKVVAVDTGATGTSQSGGNASGGNASNWTGCVYYNSEAYKYKPNAYMIDLVKKKAGESTYTRIASAVVGATATSERDKFYFEGKGGTSGARANVKYINASGTVSNVSDINGLKGLAQYLNSKHSVREISNSKNVTTNKLSVYQVGTMLKDFGVANCNAERQECSLNTTGKRKFDIKKQSDDIFDNYGYRILIQEFHIYTIPCTSTGQNKYMLRKESDEAMQYSQASGRNFVWHELKIDQGDVLGITKAVYPNNSTFTLQGFSVKTNELWFLNKNLMRNKMHGAGYNAIWVDVDDILKQHSYYIDTACTNCDSTSKNGSFIIQDITDWDAILASKDSDKDNIKNYYNKGNGVYCREEYKVDFPNDNNKVDVDGEKLFNVATGRYFTVNLQEPFVKGGIANFGPIKVTKVRQCQGTDQAKLNEFVNRYGAGQLGTITLNYKEERGKPYTLNVKLKENSDRTNPKNEVSSDGKTTTITTTKYYELPDNIYRYIKKGEGTPSETTPSSLKNYIDLKISTLPVSFSNFATGGSKLGGTISLSYELPTKGTGSGEDPKTNIKKAFDNKDYFENPAGSENIYNKYSKDNNLQGDELNQIKNSSCAKMFGYKTTEFESCVEQRKIDATTDNCRDIAKGEYTCDINVCEENETVGPDGKCCEIGKCGNAPVCRIENGKFYDQLNNEISEAEFVKQCICEVLDNGQYILRDGKLTDKYPEYLQQCPNDCPPEERNECPPETWINGDPCARCPSGACPMPGGVCPYGGDVIYRPIDLINPFPSQQGSGRQTGSNWCGYKLATGKITCAGDESNEVVKTHITNNRGTANYSVYNKKTLYTVELDANKIKEIRNYNKRNDYNDWKNIECNSTTGICSSKFLRSNVNITTGECKNVSDLKTCAEK